MSLSTNSLVNVAKRYVAPALLSTMVAVGTVAVIDHTGVHAASTATVAPLSDNSVAPLVSLDQAVEALVSHVQPSVVNIAVTSTPSAEQTAQQQGGGGFGNLPPELQQFFGFGGGGMRMQPLQPQMEHGIGSGVIISSDGYILTNNHVVDGAKDIKVTLHDRRVLNGRVVGVDKLTDLAVVKVNAHDLPALSWGDSSKLEQGQTVLAFGSPFGSLRFSVTRGIVSAVNRSNPFATDGREPGGFIQTDAAINPGNSGGPLVNVHGELVGINSSIITNSGQFAGAGFAIPSQIAHAISASLIEHGKVEHGYVGIAMNDVMPDNARFFNLKDASGAIVAQVTPDSPASKAGLEQGDVIVGLNGQRIADSSSLQVAVSEMSPGTGITLDVMRSGQPVKVHVTVGEYHAKGVEVADDDSNGDGSPQSGKLGVAVADLTQDNRQQINAPDSLHGAVIENVRPASPADDAGLQPGDVVLQVNRKPTTSASQFVGAVKGDTSDQDLLLLVWSKGSTSYRTVHLDNDGQKG